MMQESNSNTPLHLRYRLSRVSWRDLAVVVLPTLLLVIGAFVLAGRYLQPAPPTSIVMTAGTDGSAFQELVWKTLRTIPAGGTWTYGQLAHQLNRPTSARAVGHANSLNPVAIIVPCHRVIGASSSLTGYAGGLHRKQWLLHHEGALSGALDLQAPFRAQRATA